MKPKVPGSAKIGPERVGISSATLFGSFAEPPRKVKPREATKKKFSIAGGSSALPVSSFSHSGRATPSIRSAVWVVVARL